MNIEQLYEEKLQELIDLGEIEIKDSIASLPEKPEPETLSPDELKDKSKNVAQDILDDNGGEMKKSDLKKQTKQELKDNGDPDNIDKETANKAIDDAIQELEDEGEIKSDDKGNVKSSDKSEEEEEEGETEEDKGESEGESEEPEKEEDEDEPKNESKEDKNKSETPEDEEEEQEELEEKDKGEDESEKEEDEDEPEEDEKNEEEQEQKQEPSSKPKKPKIPTLSQMKKAILAVLQYEDKTEDELIADTKEYFSMED